MVKVFIGCPSYDGRIDAEVARALWSEPSRRYECHVQPGQTSLLNANCNALWALALNERLERDYGWFAILHADVVPAPWWIDTLIELAEVHGADLLSAVVAIKDGRGLVSTAISSGDPFRSACRLTLKQIHGEDFPQTFDGPVACAAIGVPPAALHVNTGCCVVRLDRDWAELGVWFESLDELQWRDGKWRAAVAPEDWRFSQRIADAGGRVMATRAVRTTHKGFANFSSDQVFGWEYDQQLAAEPAVT